MNQKEGLEENPEPLNLFFRLVIVATAIFVITIFALAANIMGDERAPMTRLIDQYSGIALTIEFIAILVFGFLAMAIDRRDILREKAAEKIEDDTKTEENKTE